DGSTPSVSAPDCANLAAPQANFTFAPATPFEGAEVTFTDTSTSQPMIVQRQWDFGDGKTSTEISPRHVYADNGSYTVTLTVTSSGGNAPSQKNQVLTVRNAAPTADMSDVIVQAGQPFTVSFTIGDPGLADRSALNYRLASTAPGFQDVTTSAAAGIVDVPVY